MENNIQHLIPPFFIYPLMAFSLGLLSIIIIPRDIYRKLFVYGFLGGFTLRNLCNLLCDWLDLINYSITGGFDHHGAPLFVAIAWIPATIMFLYFLPRKGHWFYLALYILSFNLLSSMIEATLLNNKLLLVNNFPEFWRFACNLAGYLITYFFYLKVELFPNLREN